jgi:hypothetical protein
MPVIEQNKLNTAAAPIEDNDEQRSGEQLLFDSDQVTQEGGQGSYKNDLLDLMGLGGDGEPQTVSNGSSAPKQASSKVFGLEDLLGGLGAPESTGIKRWLVLKII